MTPSWLLKIEHEAPMKDGNSTVLYTKETREY